GEQRHAVHIRLDLAVLYLDAKLKLLAHRIFGRELVEILLDAVLHLDELEQASRAIAGRTVVVAVRVQFELIVVVGVLIIEQKAKGAIVRRLDRRLYGVILPQFGGLVILKGIGALAQDVDAVAQRAPALLPRVRAGGAAPGE